MKTQNPQPQHSTDRPYIKIVADGPYLVYGKVPINQQIIMPNRDGNSWSYVSGDSYHSSSEPAALCRCGYSQHKPFCDGSHVNANWDPAETASFEPIMDDAESTEGPAATLFDNEKYCAFARFCDAHGRAWNIVERADTEDDMELLRHEVGHCPAGRLMLQDNSTGEFFEPKFDPSIGIIEDPALRISGPIWVRGGIRIESASGENYEVRNRVTICRCGQSSNKPFCDGTHASMKFRDSLPRNPTDEKF